MQVSISREYNELSYIAALSFLKNIVHLRDSNILLASGSTPIGMYKDFFELNESKKKISDSLRFYHLDEFIGVEKKYSFTEDLRSTFINPLQINHFYSWSTDKKQAQQQIEEFGQELAKNPPELCILGIGPNGHIGFNEPGSSISSKPGFFLLLENTRKYLSKRFANSTCPKEAVGFGIHTILSSKKIILLASGENKSEAVAKMLLGPISLNCPASFLRLHQNVEVFLDHAAAKDLRTRPDYFQEEKEVLKQGSKIDGNILFMSPHPDDTSISAGGFLSRHAFSNKIKTINFYSGHRCEITNSTVDQRIQIRKEESKEEAKVLNISSTFAEFSGYENNYQINSADLNKLSEIIQTEKPRHIFIPQLNDSHPAHRACATLTLEALANISTLGAPLYLWFYESPWALFQPGKMNIFVPLNIDELNTKLKAIGAHRSQVSRVPYDYGAEALARLRSVLSREQELTSYGKAAPDLGKHMECYYRIQVR